MKRVLLAVCTLLVVLLGLAHSARLPREDRYTTKYDNVNLKEILESDRLRKSYLDCLLNDKAPCTPDAKLLKGKLFTEFISNPTRIDCMQVACKNPLRNPRDVTSSTGVVFLLRSSMQHRSKAHAQGRPGPGFRSLHILDSAQKSIKSILSALFTTE
uniref:Uncharacterized protein n=1 Tax=Timema bartmani TaxID=61472 RepID=A0A7R9F3E1_9NEOP|nr:unnamed protein product [Timema bartmani]